VFKGGTGRGTLGGRRLTARYKSGENSEQIRKGVRRAKPRRGGVVVTWVRGVRNKLFVSGGGWSC